MLEQSVQQAATRVEMLVLKQQQKQRQGQGQKQRADVPEKNKRADVQQQAAEAVVQVVAAAALGGGGGGGNGGKRKRAEAQREQACGCERMASPALGPTAPDLGAIHSQPRPTRMFPSAAHQFANGATRNPLLAHQHARPLRAAPRPIRAAAVHALLPCDSSFYPVCHSDRSARPALVPAGPVACCAQVQAVPGPQRARPWPSQLPRLPCGTR